MKAKYFKSIRFILIVLLSFPLLVGAQVSNDYFTITGIVKDQRSKKKLEYVTVSIMGTNVGTITNTDGTFSIKVKESLNAKFLEVSHIGYSNKLVPIDKSATENITVFLIAGDKKLKDVIVQPLEAKELVRNAISKIADNYSAEPNLLTGFYRETVKKRRNYINISEAIINVYKTSYDKGYERDNVQVYKGRKLLSPKVGDTLAVKFLGGPNLSTYLDVVKNSDLMLTEESLPFYKFGMGESVMINERPHYIVNFEPQVILPYPLFYGKLYIDKETLTFSRAEFELDMDDKNKATQAILRKKPFNLRFKPEEVSYLVTYKQQNGRSYLNYIKNEVQFKCDWKRRLFSTNYTIVCEMVVTDRKVDDVEKISRKMTFNPNQSLSDKVSNFYDDNFWENYNIIEPTESLESAVKKLKKQ
ncbi:MAG: carboxypeptidase-like regulatory domain-containing protein [Dysgonomonas sp.]|nr:carboxypeptidase-like regulatory domain-containing protein [Dysgonomonas sp.]